MELLNTLYNLMGLVFVLGTIISMGLSLTIAQISGPLRNVRFVVVGLLANFVVRPILALLLIRVFNLDEPLAVGLLLVSLAAGAPALPKTAVFAKVDTAAATALMVLLVVATIVVLPIALPLLLTGISVTFWDIASGLVYLILIPLAVSLFVRARYPEAAASALPFFSQASNLSLLILFVLMIVLNFSNVVGLLGSGGLLASLILVILTTAGGYLLGKLGKADGWLQALGAGQRNIAAAMVVATMNFGNDEVVMVVVFSLIVMVVLIPLALELGKRRSKAGGRWARTRYSACLKMIQPISVVHDLVKSEILRWPFTRVAHLKIPASNEQARSSDERYSVTPSAALRTGLSGLAMK